MTVESIKTKRLKLCSIKDCNKKHKGLGFCRKHYARLVRIGTPFLSNKTKKICIIENCESLHYGNGYCRFHYDRIRNGISLTQKRKIQDISRICIIFGCGKKYSTKGYCKEHYEKIYRVRRSRVKNDLILQIVMNQVRKRDKHSCQWYGCGKTTSIQVHHIFPQSEYPELKYIKDYMICYCKNHHKEWHKKRGDVCYTFL